MSDTDEVRIIADTRRRLLRRSILNVLVSCAALATVFILGRGFHMISLPLRWEPIALVSGIALVVGAVGLTGSWWVTRLPPEALTQRIALRQNDQAQTVLSRLFLLFPLLWAPLAFIWFIVAKQVLSFGWHVFAVAVGLIALAAGAVFLMLLTGWGVTGRGRLIYDEELFQSFRTRGYVIGFWSLMVGLPLILAIGLSRPAWAVEALPILIAGGACVPAVTIGLLTQRAERGG
jgi:hypothetical protein